MGPETLLGIGALVVVAAFIAIAFRKGMKVRKEPEGVPPEQWPHG